MLSKKEREERYTRLIEHLRMSLGGDKEWKPIPSEPTIREFKVPGNTLSMLVNMEAITRSRINNSNLGGSKVTYQAQPKLFNPAIVRELIYQMHERKPEEPKPMVERMEMNPSSQPVPQVLLIKPNCMLLEKRFNSIDDASDYVKTNGQPNETWMAVVPVAVISTSLSVTTKNTNAV